MTPDLFPETRVDPGLDLDRRYTTRETMDLCMRLADVDEWDVDVAADAESHWASKYFAAPGDTNIIESTFGWDGLKESWFGRVWCNPPFSNIAPWVQKAWRAMADRDCSLVAMLLPANRTEQPWFQEFVEPWRDGRQSEGRTRLTTHFLPARQKFGHPGNRDAVGVGSPPFGCVLLVWRASP